MGGNLHEIWTVQVFSSLGEYILIFQAIINDKNYNKKCTKYIVIRENLKKFYKKC